MTKFKITAPVKGFRGDLAGLVFRDGAATADGSADAAALAYCRRRGYTVEPADEVEESAADAETAEEADGGESTAVRPKDYAAKPEWVAYAVERGMDKADAEAATKDQLIAQYGDESADAARLQEGTPQ